MNTPDVSSLMHLAERGGSITIACAATLLLASCAKPDGFGITVFTPNITEMSDGDWNQSFAGFSLNWNLTQPKADLSRLAVEKK